MSNKHLDQGIHFMSTKDQHKKKERSVENSDMKIYLVHHLEKVFKKVSMDTSN